MRARFRVIHHALNRHYFPSSEAEVERVLARFGLARDAEYLLHVGGNSWYKNRAGALGIFSELRNLPEFRRMKLIMAGKPWTKELREIWKAANLEDSAFDAKEVADEDLQALYTGAKALLFPSREEGFGWPILEAQACGCPVITTNRPPMTEVAGDAAILIEPERPEEAVRIIRDQWYRIAELREAGFRNLERFTETHVADAYCEVYDEAIRQRRLAPPLRIGGS
jgi:glycosyltransferase involved in cell wall biosynthesis